MGPVADTVANKISDYVESKVNPNTSFTIPPVHPDFVMNQLKTMDTSKATGPDGLSAKTLKMASPAIVSAVTTICNNSISTGHFPLKWKEARVVPIFKTGSRDECNNYRPISILPILSKILEKHVYFHLYKYLQEHSLLVKTQYGFRKHHSCQAALLSLTEQIYQAIHDEKFFGMVQLDFSKAFDLVNHKLLLQKLKLYKCDDDSLDWFTSYLSDRIQRVQINQSNSAPSKITSGVPQGSILGPLLFLLFINDMPQFLTDSAELLYADDATLTASSKNIRTIEEKLNNNCQAASEWSHNNDMVVNAKKCNSMVLATRQRMARATSDTNLKININNEPIPSVDKTKLLGLHIDNNLTWKEQIKHIHNKIASNLYLLKQIKSYLSINDRKLFYNSYILPHFDYCSTIYGNCAHYLLTDIIKLQKRAARLILDKDYTTPSSDLFKQLQWMPLEDRISYHRCIQVFKCIKGPCPENLQNLFASAKLVHTHNTRSASNNNLHIAPRHIKSFTHLGATSWNKLPPPVRDANTLPAFKQYYARFYQSSRAPPSELY